MDQLQRFIDLVNKTGDKLVIFDRYQPDNSCVILGINAYESMINKAHSLGDLTEEELADKINHDIAIWKNEHILSDVNEENFDWPEDDFKNCQDFCDHDLQDFDFETNDDFENFETDEADETEPEELNYLYPVESETIDFAPVAGFEPNELESAEADLEPEIETENSEPESITAPEPDEPATEAEAYQDSAVEITSSNDFQSLGDILGSKFERGNNWSIPSDRKRLAEDTASRYETIGF